MTRSEKRHSILATGRPLQMEEDYYLQLADDDMGVCRMCGTEVDQCEPDARRYPCPNCQHKEVYGAEELLTRGEIEFL